MAESQSIEYKSSWRDEYLKWVCGFANAKGGTFYVGIADDGSVTGLPDARRLLEDIPNKIISGLGIVAAVMLRETRLGSYLEIEVEAQAFPVSYKGQYYVRVGATNQLLSGTALDTFLLRKQGQSWDAAPVPGVKPDGLSSDAVKKFVDRAQGKGRVPDEALTEDPGMLVQHLRLDRDGYLTNAAVLLFHPEPDRFVPGCSVKIGYFEGPEILYQDELAGPIIELPDKAIDLLYTKYLKAKISYDGIRRVERYPFPLAAVREAVVNAIVHKNYQSGAPVQIRVYEDKLIIGNSCIFPEGWSVESLLSPHASEPHNPKIAHVFFLAGHIESWGRGVQKIITECKLDGIEPPSFRMAGSSLILEFVAPKDRLVDAGPSGQKHADSSSTHDELTENGTVSDMERTIPKDKRTDSTEKHDDSNAERADSAETSQSNANGFNVSTLQNIEELRRRLTGSDQFGRPEVMETIGGSDSRAGKLLRKMLDAGMIEPVKGHGKGRYRFKASYIQEGGQEDSDGR